MRDVTPGTPGVTLTAAVALAPWSAERARNVAGYGIPGLRIVADDDREGCWPTIRRAWEAGTDMRGTHHLVLTDDLTLSEGFWAALNRAVTARPHDVISLLTVRPGARDAAARGKPWCISWDGLTGAANVLPTHLIGDFLAWEAEHIDPACPHDDVRLVAWCLQTRPRRRVYTPVPCLVDHGAFGSVIEDSDCFGLSHSRASVFAYDASGLDFSDLSDPLPIGPSVERVATRIRDERLVPA